VISARVERLSLGARRLLEATALVGQPLSVQVALDATLAAHTDLDALLDAHLVRESESLGQELVECYHDRIRETVVASLSSEATREHYARLAPALARDLAQDPELVSRCWQGAGQRAEAARYAILAAERADLAMAFDHAAALYQKGLDLGAPAADETALIVRLGHALENGGRGTEAAAMYRRAAERFSGDASTELSRRAAEQLLVTGRVEEGTALLRDVCSELDVFFPRGPGSALLSLAWTGLRVRARDLDAELPDERRVSEHDALRLRTARTVVTGLIGYLPAHVASVAGRYLLTALDKGDLTERVRSIGFNAYVYSHIDPKSPRSRDLLRRMDELAEASGRAELRGFASLMKGTSAYHFDLCRDARRHFEAALCALRGCSGVTWEIDAACVYDQMSAIYCGDHAEIARSAPALVDEALRRGRVWTGAMLSGFAGMPAWLAEGGGPSYRRQLAEVARHWQPSQEPRWPDYVLLMGEALVSIFEGQPHLGFDLLDRRRATYMRYMLTRGAGKGSMGFATHHGRCAASALGTLGRGHAGRARWTRVLEQSSAALTKNPSTKAQGMASMLAAALAVQRGDTESGVALLRRALDAFERAETRMFVAAVRRRLGEMVGGDEGRELISRGDEVMLQQGVKDLDAETELSCPGFGRR
jgi:tetratricopeptide (TPR) repeat protein